jgi:hypothetical protein
VCIRKDQKVEERVCSDGDGCSAMESSGSVSGCARGGRQGDCGEPLAMEEEGERGQVWVKYLLREIAQRSRRNPAGARSGSDLANPGIVVFES